MLGEDSGIEVEALGGAPGIRSARCAPAGTEANERLLAELRGVEGDGRRARYVCELVADRPGRRGASRHGVLEGRIARRAPRHGGLRLRPGLRPDGRGADRRASSATTGSRATRTARERPARCKTPRPGLVPPPGAGSAPRDPPVHLGAEHDRVRHHVEPDEQQDRPTERLQRESRWSSSARRAGAPGSSPRA